MESKLNPERLRRCVGAVLEASARKRRRFLEFVDLQIAFSDYQLLTDKCIQGALLLRHIPKPDMRVCVLGDVHHCGEARARGLPFKTLQDLRELNGCTVDQPRQIRAFTNGFDAFVASRSALRMLRRTPVGDSLKNAGKWPKQLSHLQPLADQVDVVKATVRFCFGGDSWRGLIVGNVRMTPGELVENIDDTVSHLEDVLAEHWDNVRSMHIKSTMGPPQRIY